MNSVKVQSWHSYSHCRRQAVALIPILALINAGRGTDNGDFSHSEVARRARPVQQALAARPACTHLAHPRVTQSGSSFAAPATSLCPWPARAAPFTSTQLPILTRRRASACREPPWRCTCVSESTQHSRDAWDGAEHAGTSPSDGDWHLMRGMIPLINAVTPGSRCVACDGLDAPPAP